ncbi:hypothetical protein [Streptomyces sp. NBC_00118]|uniref:hypothetical protein n=1 Tax=unclassified Streptomyces TaxID=2593676 RepID=UPI00308E3594|nr:hypothetical protein OG518_37670 [Streptomyces sp. NBC_01397]
MAPLTDHRAVLLEHLDHEKPTLLPLAAEHITEKEWPSLGDHLVANTPKLTLLTLFGLILEDANLAEHTTLLSALPAPVRTSGTSSAALATPATSAALRATRPCPIRLTGLHRAHEDSQGEEQCR